MTTLLEIKEKIREFYGKYEIYLVPLIKFILAISAFLIINQNVGFMEKIKNPAIAFILALMCSFLPSNMIVIFSGVLIIAHFYALSMELALVTLVILVLMFLLYYKFAPKDSYIVLLTPVSFIIHIPYVMPLSMGLLGTPVSAIPVAFGTFIYYMISYVKENATTIANEETFAEFQKYSYIINQMMGNQTMVFTVIAFTITIIIVYVIRRLSIDYAWSIAIVVGALINFLMLLIGRFVFELSYPILLLIIEMIVSLVIVGIFQFFIFSVDYSRTEYVQFEDDEYYYYVKAVPKMAVTTSDKKIRKINQKKDNKENRAFEEL